MRVRFTLLSLLITAAAFADQPLCGVSEEHEARLRQRHAEMRRRSPIEANATALPATVRDGALYMQADDKIAVNGNLFDLNGQSLVFEPRGGTKFASRRDTLRYTDPGALLHDFGPKTGSPWHYVTYDLTELTFPIFGKNVTRLYLTAFNEIELAAPQYEEGAVIFDNLEAAVHRNPVLSPLVITNRKPRYLAYPQLFVRETPEALFVTWKSVAGDTFGYDVQAELRSDGTVVYSYNSMRNMEWGTPVLSPGFDPTGASTTRRVLHQATALSGMGPQFGAAGLMLDIRNIEVSRFGESDVIGVKVTFGDTIDPAKLTAGQTARYVLTVSNVSMYVEVTSSGWAAFPFNGIAAAANGAVANVSGNTIEFYFLQSPANVTTPQMRLSTQLRPTTADAYSWVPVLDIAPRSSGHDLSSLTASRELNAPISEPFVLPELDPFEVWERIQPAFALSTFEYDAIAMYQSFFTDMIFYAGAYSVGGNPAVSGIAPASPNYGLNARRHPNLLHMNHFTYNYNTAQQTASQVILHELGHRWLYFFRILENGIATSSLNPLSAHPAAYVHAPAAFPVWNPGESSVMGGAVFSEEGAGTYRTHVANRGFSWTDLYLMGLASKEEVQPWFYLAGTTLPLAYWPDHNIVVTGEKRAVNVDQIIGAHGPRNPSVNLSQKTFKVLFVLVTPEGKDASDADVAKMNEWRMLLERTFYLATGGRARVDTTFVQPAKRRSARR
jgi:hypothetical protein